MACRCPSSWARHPTEMPREKGHDAAGAGVQVFDTGQVAELAREGIQTTYLRTRLPMSLFESLRRHAARRKSRAARMLAGAWVIFFAMSVVSSGCLVPVPAAASTGQTAGALVMAAEATAHEGFGRYADCCEVMSASLASERWGAPSAGGPGATPLISARLSAYFPFAVDSLSGADARIPPAPPVPTYLLTLRLRA